MTCGKNSNITEQHVGGSFVPKLRVCIMPVNYMLNVLVKWQNYSVVSNTCTSPFRLEPGSTVDEKGKKTGWNRKNAEPGPRLIYIISNVTNKQVFKSKIAIHFNRHKVCPSVPSFVFTVLLILWQVIFAYEMSFPFFSKHPPLLCIPFFQWTHPHKQWNSTNNWTGLAGLSILTNGKHP